MFLLDLICFVVFALCATVAWNLLSLIVFRFLLVMGIGVHHPISATLLAEFSSSKTRGAHSDSLGSIAGRWWKPATPPPPEFLCPTSSTPRAFRCGPT